MRLPPFARLSLALAALAAASAWAAEPMDVGSPQLRLSTTLSMPPVKSREASEPTFTQRTQQPVEELQAARLAREHELLDAMASAASQQRTMADLETRLARARAERAMNPLVAGLLVLLAAVTAAAGLSWWKLRGREPAPLEPAREA